MKEIRVAHISLPFYNGGGLVRYVKDLIDAQVNSPNIKYVCVFYTGDYSLIFDKPKIKKHKYRNCIDLFKINNFNPTTLFEGTLYPEKDIFNEELEDVIINKLLELNINTVHFHTFHGIPFNLLKKIKINNIRIIYTAHDYIPLCNKINLLDYKNKLCNNIGEKCSDCNAYALNNKKLYIRYNYISNYLKQNTKMKTKIKDILNSFRRDNEYRKIKNYKKYENKEIAELDYNKGYKERFILVQEYLNKYVDRIIYSSNITKDVFYKNGINNDNYILLPISNKRIINNLNDYKINISHDKKLRFGYLGGSRKEKGYEILIEVFEKIQKQKILNWNLYIFGEGSENIYIPETIKDNVFIKGYEDGNIYDCFDVLLVPSIWAETFNFVTLEGIYNKKLVVASNIVGSADLYKDNGILLYKYDNIEEFSNIIKSIILEDKEYEVNISLNEYCRNIVFKDHISLIEEIYEN